MDEVDQGLGDGEEWEELVVRPKDDPPIWPENRFEHNRERRGREDAVRVARGAVEAKLENIVMDGETSTRLRGTKRTAAAAGIGGEDSDKDKEAAPEEEDRRATSLESD
jgi:hypothetical protein